jgi:GNAT superfamily N-acetyltransferase
LAEISLKKPQGREWDTISRLVGDAIPHYLVSHLGQNFGSLYYQHLTAHPGTCSLAAYDRSDNIAGFVLGTLNSKAARRLTLPVLSRLLLAANVKLLSPTFLGWLIRGVPDMIRGWKRPLQYPDARLAILVVSPEFRGQGLSLQLLNTLEEFFCQHQLQSPYCILTEKANLVANRFYKKIGARFVKTYMHHGREINEWHKLIT